MQIRIRRIHPAAELPSYAHGPHEDAGMDLRSVEDAILQPGVPQLVPTGLTIELPPGYEAQVLRAAAWPCGTPSPCPTRRGPWTPVIAASFA